MTERFFILTPTPIDQTETVKHPDGSKEDFPLYLDASGKPMKWSASFPIPAINDRVCITMNGIGPAIVKGYFESEGFVGVMTLPLNPPKWLRDQRKREAKEPNYASKPKWVKEGIGCEFGAEILPIQWLATAASGKAHTHSADDGVTGWRLHAIAATENTTLLELARKAAVCGMRPRTGWGLDLFTEQRCTRCEKKLGLR
jgi:hypothetical protein